MKKVVISLGGSLIVPEQVDFKFLHKFKKTLEKHYKTHKFIIVCGGGVIARKYISALEREGKSKQELAFAGIRATRMNALFMMQFFGKEANGSLPLNMGDVESALNKNNVVVCGALRFSPDSTSDTTAAKLAHFLKTDFINMTNVKGLYTDDPKTNKEARFIPKLSWRDFEKMALKIKFKAGQHFVLDQNAAAMIKENKIKTYIIGKNPSNISRIIHNKKFAGTTIDR